MVDFLLFHEHFLSDLVRSTITLLIVLDPVGIVPIFLSLTQKMELARRAEVSKTGVITAAGLLLVFALGGTQIFGLFGISIQSFMVAGGILLFIVAIELLSGGWKFIGSNTAGDTGVVPLAFPLLAGPGAITAVIISLETIGLLTTMVSIAIAISATYITLRYSHKIFLVIGRRGSLIVTRVFAVFVAAIAVQYVVEGAKALFT